MRSIVRLSIVGLALLAGLSLASGAVPGGPAQPAAPAAAGVSLTSGWVLLKEGTAEGTLDADAKHDTNTNPHLLRISVTKYVDEPGKGRIGAKNTRSFSLKEGQYYDITFQGISEGIGVGLVFSFEDAQGRMLARTTLPEIGRGGRGGRGRGTGGGATVQPGASNWQRYLVSLKARESSGAAFLTVTPIEPVPVWLENVTVTERNAQ